MPYFDNIFALKYKLGYPKYVVKQKTQETQMKTFFVEIRDNGTNGRMQAYSQEELTQQLMTMGFRSFKISEV